MTHKPSTKRNPARGGFGSESHAEMTYKHGVGKRLLFLHVRCFALAVHAAIVFFADELQNFPGGMKFHLKFLAPWRREDLGIVDGDLVGDSCRIDVMQAFD